jgi:LEA14-like dessication related protein
VSQLDPIKDYAKIIQIGALIINASPTSTTPIPLHFTINVDVTNPNSDAASFESLQYIISIDDVHFTTGDLTDPLRVGAGETTRYPVRIKLNYIDLIKDGQKQVVEKILLNLANNDILFRLFNVEKTKSNVTIQVKPSFKVGKLTFTAPSYIPVHFSF